MALTIDSLQILQDLSKTLEDAYDISYSEALSGAAMWLPTLAAPLTTQQRSVDLPFLYDTLETTVGEEGDPPHYQNMLGDSVNIKLKKLFNAARVKILDFQDPGLRNMVISQVQGMAAKMAYEPQYRAVNMLNVGDTDSYYTTYDGEQLFSASHLVGAASTSWGNLTTGALTATTFDTVRTNFRQIPWGNNGRFLPMGNATYYLIVPPSLENEAWDILFNNNFPEATYNKDNFYKGKAQLIVDENLTDANDWFMAVTLPNAKPMIHLKHSTESGNSLVPETDANSEAVVQYDEYRWTVKSFEEVFPGQFWLLAKAAVA